MANPTSPKPEAAELNAAFEALKSYAQGSSRGALVPIDQAVKASLGDEPARAALEQRLLSALHYGGSAAAVEFICSKLALIGSKPSVTPLATLLGKPEFATAARTVLETIPGDSPARALRKALPKVEGLQKIGVIHSLGARRDEESVRPLTALLKSEDSGVAAAAVAALGDIATSKAAKVLLKFQPKAPPILQPKFANALLVCAERLLAAGRKADARNLYRSLATSAQPRHVQQAAARGLEVCSSSR
ncbi:MAG TPA: HEAT repeat domain-containing protein [Verrucomicrobiae bacterium]